MVSMLFRDPQARSSAFAALGTLQPRAFGSLNRVETLDSGSNYYLMFSTHCFWYVVSTLINSVERISMSLVHIYQLAEPQCSSDQHLPHLSTNDKGIHDAIATKIL